MVPDRKKLVSWVARQKILEEDDACYRLDLRHLTASEGRSGSVWSIEMSKDLDAETTAIEIEQFAEDDATGIGGTQRYVVLAVGKKKEPMGRFTFRMWTPDVEGLSDTEPASKDGVLAQSMRHSNDAQKSANDAHRVSIGSTGEIIRHYQKMLDSAYKRIETLEEKHLSGIETYEELMSARHERELETLRSANKEKRQAEMFENVMMLVPSAINRISGKNLLPEKTTPQSEMLQKFMGSLTPEQVEKLHGVLSPAQLITVFSLWEAAKTEHDKREESKSLVTSPANGAKS